MTQVTVKVDADNLIAAMKHAPKELLRNLPTAGLEALKEILDTQGVRNYPPETAANLPPTPYYIRGQGTQYAGYNKGNSEQYGKSWTDTAHGYKARATSSASYGIYVSGDAQPAHMAQKGWRKVADVAKEKMKKIQAIYNKWIAYSLRQAGL
jgi:hypothetical protein